MCNKCNYDEWLDDINEMQLNEDYIWADDTLEGIKIWVSKNAHITERQIEAIENIKEAVENR